MHFKIKQIGKRKYLYLIENQRVGGKVKQVQQLYVGTADKIYQMLTQEGEEFRVRSYDFGRVAALLHASEELGLVDAINRAIPKKDVRGLSIGEYILLLIIARANNVLSRRGVESWFKRSLLQFLWKLEYSLQSQNLLNQMRKLDKQSIEQIEEELAGNLLAKGISPTRLIFDTTNEFTYIENGETLPRHGKSKAMRYDKRLVGLGLVVSDFNLPFLTEVYPGSEHDSRVFVRILDVIEKRLERLKVNLEDLTLIFDKGVNSEQNLELVLKKIHVVGSLSGSQAKSLFSIPLENYHPLYKDSKRNELMGYRTRKTVFGQDFTIILSYNPSAHRLQQATYERGKKKILEEVEELKRRDKKSGRGRKMTAKGAINTLANLIPKQLRGIFKYRVIEIEGRIEIECRVDPKAEKELYQSFGKIAIFTDLHQAEDEQLVRSYNSKSMIEDDFKWLKDKTIMPLMPFWVRLDLSIRAHVFICVLGLLLYRYLLWRIGEKLSIPGMVDILGRIRLAVVASRERKPKIMLEEMDAEEARIFTKLNLSRYIPG